MANFTGDSGDNSIVGTGGSDSITISQGGEDTVLAGDGSDFVFLGASFDAGDHIDGEGGTDYLHLTGDYSAGLTITGDMMTNVENVVLNGHFNYDLTLADSLVFTGHLLVQHNMFADTSERIDASAFSTGHDLWVNVCPGAAIVIGGAGDDRLNANDATGTANFAGGAGNDTFHLLTRAWAAGDRFDGGDGYDSVQFTPSQTVVFTGKSLKNVEAIACTGSADITMSDGNLTAGGTMAVSSLGTLRFDGSHERSGAFVVNGSLSGGDTLIGGGGGDTISGGGGDDILQGGKGADVLSGVFDSDTFVYAKLSDSGHHKQFDLITDLSDLDHIDLSAIDANSLKDGDQAFHLTDQFHNKVGELVLSYDSASDLTTLAVDVNGDGRADMALHIQGDHSGFAGLVL